MSHNAPNASEISNNCETALSRQDSIIFDLYRYTDGGRNYRVTIGVIVAANLIMTSWFAAIFLKIFNTAKFEMML